MFLLQVKGAAQGLRLGIASAPSRQFPCRERHSREASKADGSMAYQVLRARKHALAALISDVRPVANTPFVLAVALELLSWHRDARTGDRIISRTGKGVQPAGAA